MVAVPQHSFPILPHSPVLNILCPHTPCTCLSKMLPIPGRIQCSACRPTLNSTPGIVHIFPLSLFMYALYCAEISYLALQSISRSYITSAHSLAWESCCNNIHSSVAQHFRFYQIAYICEKHVLVNTGIPLSGQLHYHHICRNHTTSWKYKTVLRYSSHSPHLQQIWIRLAYCDYFEFFSCCSSSTNCLHPNN